MYRSWGVPNVAKEFAAACDKQFGGLRLYPFVGRYNCTEPQSYRTAVDDGFKVVRATPHPVPAHCWDYLRAPVRAVPVYRPYPNPHIGDWLRHDPPREPVTSWACTFHTVISPVGPILWSASKPCTPSRLQISV